MFDLASKLSRESVSMLDSSVVHTVACTTRGCVTHCCTTRNGIAFNCSVAVLYLKVVSFLSEDGSWLKVEINKYSSVVVEPNPGSLTGTINSSRFNFHPLINLNKMSTGCIIVSVYLYKAHMFGMSTTSFKCCFFFTALLSKMHEKPKTFSNEAKTLSFSQRSGWHQVWRC
jgi:hypothetical protein